MYKRMSKMILKLNSHKTTQEKISNITRMKNQLIAKNKIILKRISKDMMIKNLRRIKIIKQCKRIR